MGKKKKKRAQETADQEEITEELLQPNLVTKATEICEDVKAKVPLLKNKEKRKEGVDGYRGHVYEYLLPALLSLRLLSDEKIEDFSIRSGVEAYGKFDDVILSITLFSGEKKAFALQLKHKMTTFLDVKQGQPLEVEKGPFSIPQLLESFTNIDEELRQRCHFVLYTNDGYSNSKPLTKFEVLNFNESCPGKLFLNTSCRNDGCSVYKFTLKDQTDVVGNASTFYEQFSLYVSQSSVNDIQDTIQTMFVSQFKSNEDTCREYIDFYRTWYEDTELILTKGDIEFQLLYALLKDYIVEFNDIHETNMLFLKGIAASCDVVLIENCTELIKNKMGPSDPAPFQSTREDIFKMWCYRNQLVIKESLIEVNDISEETITNAIHFYYNSRKEKSEAEMKFILVGQHIEKRHFEKLIVIQTLEDLRNMGIPIYEEISRYEISIQGRKFISVREFIDTARGTAKSITLKHILQIRNVNFIVGKKLKKLVEDYIPRTLLCNVVGRNIFNREMLEGSLFVVISVRKFTLTNVKIVTVDQFLTADYSEDVLLLEKDLEVALKNFTRICKISKKQNVVLLRNVDRAEFEILKIHGSISNIHKFKTTEAVHVQESDIFKMIQERSIVLICAKSGMGKTVFTTYLSINCPSALWVVNVSLIDQINFFRTAHNPANVLEYLISASCDDDKLSMSAAKSYEKRQKILFIFDGFDELPHNCVTNAAEAIRAIFEMGFYVVITSKTNCEQFLEQELKVFSFKLREINREEQEKYMTARLMGSYSFQEVEDLMVKVWKNKTIIKNNDVLGVPLQLFMLTDILVRKRIRRVEDLFILTNMYEHFFRGKYDHFKDKKKINRNDLSEVFSDVEDYRFENYQLAALASCLDPQHLGPLEASLGGYFRRDKQKKCDLFLGKIEKDGDHLGIIDRISDGTVIYVHKSYAEYFAALWLSENFEDFTTLSEFMFDEKYENIRLIFDMLLAKDCPAHLAVFYLDFDELKSLPVDKSDLLDRGGRNPMHIFCGWEQRFPILKFTCSNADQVARNEVLVDWSSLHKITEEDKLKSSTFLKYLIERFDPLENDKLYMANAISYADKALCLLPLNEFILKYDTILEELVIYNDIYSVLVYSVVNDFWNLFNSVNITEIPKIEVYSPNNNNVYLSILELAAQYSEIKYVKRLLENRAICGTISNISSLGALDWAMARNNQKEMVKLLLDHGAKSRASLLSYAIIINDLDFLKYTVNDLNEDVNEYDSNSKYGSSLIDAISYEELEIAEYLISQGADVNKNDTETNPLIEAFLIRNLPIVKLLCKSNVNFCFDFKGAAYLPALAHAIRSQDIGIVSFLIDSGANVIEKFRHGKNSLLIASEYSSVEITKLILHVSAGQENNNSLRIDLINSQNSFGETALHLAAKQNRIENVRYLIIEGVDVNQQNKNGDAPLHFAALKGFSEAVNILLDSGAEVDIKNMNGETPLLLASLGGHVEIIGIILKNGATIDVVNNNCDDALMLASASGSLEMVEFLYSQSFSQANKNKQGNCAFLLAAMCGHLHLVQFFATKENTNIDVTNESGETALMLSMERYHRDVVELLLELRTKVQPRKKGDGYTALHIGAISGRSHFVQLLVEQHGANVDDVNLYGERAFTLAAIAGNEDVYSYLRFRGTDYFDSEHESVCRRLQELVDFQESENLMASKQQNISDLIRNTAHIYLLITRLLSDSLQDELTDRFYKFDCVRNSVTVDSVYLLLECLAAQLGHTNVIQFLHKTLYYRDSPLQSTQSAGFTSLHVAIREGSTNFVKTITNKIYYNYSSSTFLHLARKAGRLDIAKYLSEINLDVFNYFMFFDD